MTAYLASASFRIEWTGGSTPGSPLFTVQAGSYELRIARIEIARIDDDTDANDAIFPKIYRYVNATVTGGSTYSAVPLRQGSPAATTTCRKGSLSISGTSSFLTATAALFGGSQTYEPPFDLTISPGSALVIELPWHITGDPSDIDGQVTVYFEELRLSWHY